MKSKIFYTILASLLATTAQAGQWEYDYSGKATGLYGYSDVASQFEKQNSNNHGVGDGSLSASAKYVFNEDYTAGVYLDLMAGVDHELEDYNQGKWGEEAYSIIDSPYGRLMLGQTTSVAAQFHQGAPDVGPLGIENSDIVDFISNPNWQRRGSNARFATLNTTSINTDGVAPKASYISPEFYGTRAGFTYVPDSYNRRGLISKDAAYEDKDAYIAALYNTLDLGFAEVSSSVAYGEFLDNDKEFSASLSLQRGGWTVGSGWRKTYIDGDEHPINTSTLFDNYREGQAWNIGVGYEIGPYKASLSYLESKAENTDNRDEIIMLSNKYQINKYVDIYLSAAHVDFKGSSAALEENNKGYAFITGMSLNF